MSFFEKMKEKWKNEVREKMYYRQLLGSVTNMFAYDGLPTIEETGIDYERYIERRASQTGCVCGDMIGDKLIIFPDPSFTGNEDFTGIGENVTATSENGQYQITEKPRTEVAILFNNTNHCPDTEVIAYANALMQIDKAIMVNTKLAGFAPLFSTNNSKTQSVLESILDSLYDGNIRAIVGNETMEAILNGRTEANTVSIDSITPQRVQYVQYLSQCYDNMLRRFYNLFGVDIAAVNKQAQVNTEEINGWSGFAEIMKQDRLKQRQEFCKQLNKLFGLNVSVRFRTPYREETEQFMDASTSEEKPTVEEPETPSNEAVKEGAYE